MGYAGEWKVLEAMIADLRENGVMLPPETMVELRSAKTLIAILLADPNCAGISQKIEECLFNVESSVMAKGETMLGNEYFEKWSIKMDQARKKPVHGEDGTSFVQSRPNFPLGLPRNSSWVRLEPLPEFPVDRLRRLADASHVSCTLQSNGSLLCSGGSGQLKEFIRNVASGHQV